MLIPWIVTQELDGLKSSSNSYSNGGTDANVSYLARQAINFIYQRLLANDGSLRGQKLTEAIDPKSVGDDAILDCCRYWREKHNLTVTLLSDDKNLCVKTMVHGLLK